MRKTVILFGTLGLALVLFFKISTYILIQGNTNIELILVLVALIFFFTGIYLNKKSLQKKDDATSNVDLNKVQKLEISEREYQVLKEVALGLSNKEIADKLYLTESTIKTHVSNLLFKLNAKRRTQAVQIAKELQIL
ncbi:response regulator transcription factor [Maribacter sp. PR1]|uniref:Response regulator transcription factor n=1 Tax=Maribacter cobaltidurans TaxID=1178778 RepID=A0ABU7IQZ7_9FLAO|nr:MULTISPECIES: response regulator transcription factor [Maribacter]MDC6387583.1 response regulator transcription factor [Maribacter sp. PR1]MEE1974971.1 response regulator transcription factor [Maribacter cobaltidurans]